MQERMRWDLFCHVIDNFGDIGVCWRLAADLGSRGQTVRLWIDDPSALSWMAPVGAAGVQVLHWTAATPLPEPGDVVVEAFGCNPPADFVSSMTRRSIPPLWINLEYLSAQTYAQRSHGLPSPQLSGPGQGLDKWFFYPGFSAGTGGLIREPGLLADRESFDARDWLQARGLGANAGERVVSLFCYDSAPLPQFLTNLASEATLLLLTPGAAQRGARAWRDAGNAPRALRCIELPWLNQPDYDRLLWACDLNFVRGEDSFVRAQWAGVPFVWQIYPQHDVAHADKLEAFLDLFLAGAEPALDQTVRGLWRGWNSLQAGPAHWPPFEPWQAQTLAWRTGLLRQLDLASSLLDFVREKR